MIKTLMKLFTVPTPVELARRELYSARRELLSAQSTAEFADAMVVYNTARIERLTDFLEKQNDTSN